MARLWSPPCRAASAAYLTDRGRLVCGTSVPRETRASARCTAVHGSCRRARSHVLHTSRWMSCARRISACRSAHSCEMRCSVTANSCGCVSRDPMSHRLEKRAALFKPCRRKSNSPSDLGAARTGDSDPRACSRGDAIESLLRRASHCSRAIERVACPDIECASCDLPDSPLRSASGCAPRSPARSGDP